MPTRPGLIPLFVHHPVAANLLMILMLMAGVWALGKLNTQFFPNFALERVSVRVAWSGAAPEDVQTSITEPLERELRYLDGLRNITATSATGVAALTLEYEDGTDMGAALDEVKQRIDRVRNLPSTAEEPEVSSVTRYDPIARIMLTGPDDPAELRHLARRFERELLERGVARISLSGLPAEELAIEIPGAVLHELGLSLPVVAQRLADFSRDLPAGIVGRDEVARQLRSLDQRRSERGFAELPVQVGADGQRVTLGDVATLTRRPKLNETRLLFNGKPAVELQLQRAESADALDSARIMREWLDATRPTLPPGIELTVFDESWELIRDRITLLLKNGLSGLLLVVVALLLFLNGRVAFWVAMGIPTSFMATLLILYLSGGSLNMLSLFALIMALGIIVDDAIVVGEDALAHYEQGANPAAAAESGARRMLAPVLASSLTTVAAFLPLMLIGGTIGKLLFAIPLVIVCVILASLIESFLVLPGHLRATLQRHRRDRPHRIRQRLEAAFDRLREGVMRPLVSKALDYRCTTLAAALASLIICVGLMAGGRLSFTFFPSPEGSTLYASASFVAGTPQAQVETFMQHLNATLRATETQLGGGLIVAAQTRLGQTLNATFNSASGEQHGSMIVELTDPDQREVRLNEFLEVWREQVQRPPGLESFTLFARIGGPPGRDIDIRLTGPDPERMKAAALDLAQTLDGIAGVSAIEDDMPYGKEQLIFRLTPAGEALGLTVEDIGRQLRAAYDGLLVQIFLEGVDEIEVRVLLPADERGRLADLDSFTVLLPGGGAVPLVNAVDLSARRGFEALRHANGQLAVQVSADVDNAIANANDILKNLRETVLPELATRHGVTVSFEGRSADQAETLADMRQGALFGIALIYLILAWVFGSYGWPLIVMTAIPFGLVGAIFGHWLLGIDLTILSLFGLFGLSGIVINDSIILVAFYQELRANGLAVREALIEAACQRLRAVLLTSLTTIGGLLPLLFETSLQAQFLIPMAVSISFGLGFATLLVLFFVPALLSVYESVALRLQRIMQARTV